MNHKPIAFFITLAVYTGLFTAWLYSAPIKSLSDKKCSAKKLAVVQMQIITPPAPKPAPKSEPVIESVPESVKAAEKLLTAEPKPSTKKIKIKKKIVKKEPVKQASDIPVPVQKQVTQTIIMPTIPTKPEITIQAERNLFLTALKKKINQNKHYPQSAARRHIAGTVDAHFCIGKEGCLEKVHCQGAHRLLNQAAKRSIQDSFPVHVPDAIKCQFPMDVTLQIDFRQDSA